MIEFLSSLETGAIIPIVALICGAIIVVARYVFVQADEFGQSGTARVSSDQLQQLVSEAVRESTEPLRQRIEGLEAKIQRIAASVERDPRNLPTPEGSLSAGDDSPGGTNGSAR